MNWYFMAFQKYAEFKGRSRRKEYWMFVLFNAIAGWILSAIDIAAGLEFGAQTIYSFATIVPSIAVGVRRMHDVGKSGWFLIIPFYNFILLVSDSEESTNEYGANPKNPTDELNEIGTTQA